MPRITKRPQAIRDPKDIWLYIAGNNPSSADKVLLQIEEKLQLLLQFPQLGRRRPELVQSIHSFVVGSYVVFYFAVDDGIEVVRVLHSARDLLTLFGEES